jgi:phenylalanyl-tRNA synthetase alpha subunit
MPTPEEVIQSIESRLQVIETNYRQRFASANTPEALNTARACILGKQSDFTEVLRMMGEVATDRKREMGGRINAFRADVESAYHARMVEIR